MAGFGCVGVLAASPAAAEMPVPPCYAGGWGDDAAFPRILDALPVEPTLLLPLLWNGASGGPWPGEVPADPLAPDVLTVTVTGVDGVVVPGVVGRADLSEVTANQAPDRPSWRPMAPLDPGASYAMHIAVPAVRHSNCDFPAVSTDVTLNVAAVTEPPTLSMHVTSWDHWGWITTYGACGSLGGTEQQCPEHPNVCCAGNARIARGLRAQLTFGGTLPGGPPHHALALVPTAFETTGWRLIYPYPAGPGAEYLLDQISTDGTPPAVDSLCVEAVRRDITTGTATAPVIACADPAEHHSAGPLPEVACEASRCAEGAWILAQPNPPEPVTDPEPGPEPIAERGPEPPGADVAAPGADVAERLTAEGVADSDGPSGASAPEGCRGAGGDLASLLVLLAMVALFDRVRRLGLARPAPRR